jgi:predicted negative regulator of RcsB-dependent stress response
MPQALILVFLLFFAVLAFGWFYWQRAKTRTASTTAASEPAETTDSTPAS